MEGVLTLRGAAAPAAGHGDAAAALLHAVWPAARLEGDQVSVRATVMRGGTSRGVFFHAHDLPEDASLRDRAILSVFGSPDARQIDGLGGATPLTSKVAVISPSADPHADVDYVFGQVRVDEPRIDYAGTCGNLLAAVGPFAIDEGLVRAPAASATVRIRVVASGQVVTATVPTADGRALVSGAAAIAGVPGSGAPISIDFGGLGGTLGRGLLPTGRAHESLGAGSRSVRASIVDAGNPSVFIPAAELGLTPDQLFAGPLAPELRDRLLAVRGIAAKRLGLVDAARRAAAESPAVPKVYVVGPAAGYCTRTGDRVEAGDVTLLARGLSMGAEHPAIASTVAVCIATAARLPGTVVEELVRGSGARLRIGHPSGVFEIGAEVSPGPEPVLLRATVVRTARRLMSGVALVPVSALVG
jgi:2-methylaconitate cis-trans-isomerase PrpF